MITRIVLVCMCILIRSIRLHEQQDCIYLYIILRCRIYYICKSTQIYGDLNGCILKDIDSHIPNMRPVESIQTTSDSWHGDIKNFIFNAMIPHLYKTALQSFHGRFSKVSGFCDEVIYKAIVVLQISQSTSFSFCSKSKDYYYERLLCKKE